MLYNSVDNITDDLKLSVETLHGLCEVIDTPRSLAVSLMIQYQEWEEYLDLSIDSSAYEDPQHFAEDYLVTEILRKHPDIPLGIDKAQVALDSFKLSEARCYSSNIRLRQESREWQHSFSRNVAKILGPLTQRDLRFIEENFKHGPGATTGVRGVGSCPSFKYDRPIHTTVSLVPFFKSILGDVWWEHHKHSVHTIVDGNKFTTVPKSAKTERGICIEPTLNMYVQLGIGKLLRSKLRRFGLNLNSQERNRELAEAAYSCELATIDLSAASDSVCAETIMRHLPERWVHLLELTRSGFCRLPSGELIELAKWSSMGNGYTFELETLVFYALCMTFVPLDEMHYVSVYGDDIIVPRRYASALIEALDFLGFKVNTSKSFLAGNFFESCGSDFFKGVNVRPFYLKGSTDNLVAPLQMANKLRLWARRVGYGSYCPRKYQAVWESLRMKVRRDIRRCKVPPELGDAGLISSLDEACPKSPRHWIEGYVVRHMVTKPINRLGTTLGVLLHAYTRTGTFYRDFRLGYHDSSDLEEVPFTRGRETVRGYVRGVRTKMTIVKRWSCGLEWR